MALLLTKQDKVATPVAHRRPNQVRLLPLSIKIQSPNQRSQPPVAESPCLNARNAFVSILSGQRPGPSRRRRNKIRGETEAWPNVTPLRRRRSPSSTTRSRLSAKFNLHFWPITLLGLGSSLCRLARSPFPPPPFFSDNATACYVDSIQ